MHLMFGSFDGSRASWYVAKKNHISFQRTCSVLKLSTVALPVRSSETWSRTRRSNFGIVFSGELNLSERLTKGSCTIYSPKKLISTQMRPTISLLNFQIYWMTVLYPGGWYLGLHLGYGTNITPFQRLTKLWKYTDKYIRHSYEKTGCTKIVSISMLISSQLFSSTHSLDFVASKHIYLDSTTDSSSSLLIYFARFPFKKKFYFAWSTLITSKKKRHIWCRRSAFRVAGVFTSSFVLNMFWSCPSRL